jgi:carboxypeptidase Taq
MGEDIYQRLADRFARLAALGDAAAVLHWDMATMMPPGGAEARGRQLAELNAVQHGILTDPETEAWLDEAEAEGPWAIANLAEMRRRWTHATALDEALVKALTTTAAACETAWRGARADNDFAAVLPHLDRLLALVQESAAAKADRLGLDPYDALLDQYDPGTRRADIDPVFADLAEFLPGFLDRVLTRQAARPAPQTPPGPFPLDRQQALARGLMAEMGFDFDHGRLDISLHPFCGGTVEDVRITTRYDETDFTSALMGVLHETGHALYERGLPADWRGQPVGEARGMSLHESQSLLVEMQVCRSRPFLAYAAPRFAAAFDGDGPAWTADNLYRLQTRVEAGLIRVDADEVTYPAHIILRYELETAMLAGDLRPADLPGAWNDAMARLLGRRPPDDRDGCLQDVHWYDGAFGYFPTYTLGAMAAAQLFAAARAADADIVAGIERGDFRPLFAWLSANVHGRASSVSMRDILIDATGRPLDTAVFKAHLKERYLDGNGDDDGA